MILVPLLKLNQMYSFDYRNSSMQPDDWYIYIDCMHNDWEEVSVQKITIVNSNMNIACVCFMQYKFHRIVCFFKTLHSAHQGHPMNVAMHKHAYPQHEAQTLALGSLWLHLMRWLIENCTDIILIVRFNIPKLNFGLQDSCIELIHTDIIHWFKWIYI